MSGDVGSIRVAQVQPFQREKVEGIKLRLCAVLKQTSKD